MQTNIEVTIIKKEAFQVSGKACYITGQDNSQFASFWQTCHKDGTIEALKEIAKAPNQSVTNSSIMGVSRVEKDPSKRAFTFYIAVETKIYDKKFESFKVEANLWAIFKAKDKTGVEDLISSEMYAFREWLPSSNYIHAMAPEIEVYSAIDDSVSFWLPIIKKEDNEMVEDKTKKFWNDAFSGIEPMKIDKKDIVIENNYDQDIVDSSKGCHKVLDFGCGITFNLFCLEVFNQELVEAVGIDTSSNAIEFLNKTKEQSNFKKLKFVVGDYKTLKTYQDELYDLIICSNVLDCITPNDSLKEIKELTRILKKGGTFLLKVNFFLPKESAVKSGLVSIDEHSYTQNGIFRIAFFEDEYWINTFKEVGLTLIKQDLFQRNPKGPKDRIFIFTK